MAEVEEKLPSGRDIWEVANQLEGYVDMSTPDGLAAFLLREGKAAAELATTITTLRRERDEARAALAKEREECAKVADEAASERRRDAQDFDGVGRSMTESDGWEFAADEARLIAAAIRARTGETR